jgi:hypothetical protein
LRDLDSRHERERNATKFRTDLELSNMMTAHDKELERLTEQFDRERGTLLEQVKMLQGILQPAVEPSTMTFEPSEEAEHLAFAAETGQLNPDIYSALAEVGLDPVLTIEPGTD